MEEKIRGQTERGRENEGRWGDAEIVRGEVEMEKK